MLTGTRWQIALARRLLLNARRRLYDADPFAASEAVIAAQDAAELLLLAIAEVKGIEMAPKEGFASVLGKLAAKEKTVAVFVAGLERLNHLRVGAKHKALRPSDPAARESLEHATVAMRTLAQQLLGIDVDRVSLGDWLEHRGVASALARAEGHLDAWKDADREGFLDALAEALHFARLHAAWLVDAKRPPDFVEQLRRERTRDSSRAAEQLASLVTGEFAELAKSLNDLRMGIDPEDARLWAELLPNVTLSHAGKFFHVASPSIYDARFDEQSARRLYLSVLAFAERLDGRHPPLHPDGLSVVRSARDAPARFGSGEWATVIGHIREGQLYRSGHGAEQEGYRKVLLFGLSAEVPADAITDEFSGGS